jgi:LuxR family maltose regulon positive regulatory protein
MQTAGFNHGNSLPIEWQRRHSADARQGQSQPSPTKLLLTKLYKPNVLDTWVRRPRLLRALEDGLTRKLILVDAPAGYGKTTLLAQWLSAQPLASAWLSLDDADNDLVVFLAYVAQAARTVYPGGMQSTAMLLGAAHLPPPDDLANTLINEFDALPGELILVLDDFHLVQSQQITHLMSRVVTHLPPNLHLVLATRSDPALPLARLRARSELLEIRAVDLRFLPEEARAFIGGAVSQPVAEGDLRTLQAYTEGWPAGLRLAALSLTAADEQHDFIAGFASHGNVHVADYLADEVLARLSEPVQDFLLRASVPDRFCAALCDALCACEAKSGDSHAEPHSATLLDEIKRQNLFLIPLDDTGEWFRFHHLFRNFLRAKLRMRLSPEAIAALHRCAGDWLAEQGWLEEALQQAQAAGDFERIARLIETNMHGVLNREEALTLKRWLAFVPDEIVQRRPRLLLAKAYQLTRQEMGGVLPLVEKAEHLLQSRDLDLGLTDDERAAAMGDVLALRARATIDVDVTMAQSCARLAQHALDLLPEQHYYARATALAARATALQMSGQQLEAEMFLEREAARPGAMSTYTLRILQYQWNLAAFGANIAQASMIADRYLAAAESAGLIMNVCWAHLSVGLCRHEVDDFQCAIEHFGVVARHGQRAAFRCHFFVQSQLAMAHQATGQPDLADAAVEALRAHARSIHSTALWARVEAIVARLCLLRGDLEGAMRWVHSTSLQSDPTGLWFNSIPALVRAQILIAHRSAQSLADAADAVRDLRCRAEAWGYHYQSARIMAVQASLLWACDRHDEALQTMADAAVIGQRGGLIRAFADLGADVREVMRALAAQAGHHGLDNVYLSGVIDAFEVAPAPDAARAETKRPRLTQRETDVLELLSRRRSDKEIAEALVISRLTVSRHTANIYRKLGVVNRREAVTKARTLGLLNT